MAQPTTTVSSSLNYFGSQAGDLLNHAATHLQNAFDRVRSAVYMLRNTARAASYGLRQEVPFERWFFDHGFQKPIDNPSDLIKAHVWAVLAAGEGIIRTTAEATAFIFSRLFEPSESERHLNVLKAQWQGLTLSLLAVISPNLAKATADNQGGRPLIGCSLIDWKWGMLYTGKLDVPLWHCECKEYPWADPHS